MLNIDWLWNNVSVYIFAVRIAELKIQFHFFLFQTIGAAFGANKVIVGNKSITLGIWVGTCQNE